MKGLRKLQSTDESTRTGSVRETGKSLDVVKKRAETVSQDDAILKANLEDHHSSALKHDQSLGETTEQKGKSSSDANANANSQSGHPYENQGQNESSLGELVDQGGMKLDLNTEEGIKEFTCRNDLRRYLENIIQKADKDQEGKELPYLSFITNPQKELYAFEYQKGDKFTITLTDDPYKAVKRLNNQCKLNLTKESLDKLKDDKDSEVGTYFEVGKDLKVGEKLEDDNKSKARKKWGIIRQCAIDFELAGKIKDASKIRFDLPDGTSLNLVKKKVKNAKNEDKIVWCIVNPDNSDEKKSKSLWEKRFGS